MAAAEAVLDGAVGSAFCLVRPPGHHATPGHAMGFCLFNNVAVAAAHLLEARGLSRIAIVDFDVHHGNGTQDIFYRDGRVLYFSTHQHPYYPGTGYFNETGEGPGEGAIVNVPRRRVDDNTCGPIARSAPVVRSSGRVHPGTAGFDAHGGSTGADAGEHAGYSRSPAVAELAELCEADRLCAEARHTGLRASGLASIRRGNAFRDPLGLQPCGPT
jgi:acetoin utilization deacetylase AcuC-like enzyme